MTSSYTLIERLARHLQRPVSAHMRAKARLHLLDWIACVAGGRRSPVAAVLSKAEPDPVMRAAMLGNILEMDDIERRSILHPGPVVWPAALAATREANGSLDMLLDAAVRGYEAMIAIGATFDAHHYAHFHNTSTAGGFGAAAAALSAFGNDEPALVSALGNVGSVAGGLWHMRHDDVMTKQWHVAHAVKVGIWVAQLSRGGFTGPRALLEGTQGFYAGLTAEPKPMLLGDGWAIENVSFKPWAACRHAHPAIDCALELLARGQLKGPVRVETYRDAIAFCDRPQPQSETQAKFSLQHAISVVALADAGDPASYLPAMFNRPDMIAWRAEVTVCEEAGFSARFPDHYGARVTSEFGQAELIDTRGDPERPLDQAGIIAKANRLFTWGGVESGPAIEAALHGDDVSVLVTALESLV